MKKLDYLFYMPGGKAAYVQSLINYLEFVRQKRPKRKDLAERISNKPGVANGSIRLLKRIHFIAEKDNIFDLTKFGYEVLALNDVALVFQALKDSYPELAKILELLYYEPLTLENIIEAFKKQTIETGRTQWKIRLNWLIEFTLHH